MSDLTLTKTRIQNGVYEGILKSAQDIEDAPNLLAMLLEEEVGDVSLTKDKSLSQTWHLKYQIPSEALSDGIQTFVILDADSEETLDSFSIMTGEPLNDDLQAEVDLLRAELDMLKKAFRRHCVETT